MRGHVHVWRLKGHMHPHIHSIFKHLLKKLCPIHLTHKCSTHLDHKCPTHSHKCPTHSGHKFPTHFKPYMPYPHLPLLLCEILNTDAPVVLVLPHSTHNIHTSTTHTHTHTIHTIRAHSSKSSQVSYSHTQTMYLMQLSPTYSNLL